MFDFNGNALASMNAFKPASPTPIEKPPSQYHTKLEQNYPNPFNPVTVIPFQVSRTAEVRLTVYNEIGQKVETLVNTRLSAGYYTKEFNSKNVSSGLYLYKLTVGNQTFIKKMLILK